MTATSYEHVEFTKAIPTWREPTDMGVRATPDQLVRWADVYRLSGPAGRTRTVAPSPLLGNAAAAGERYGGLTPQADGSLTHEGRRGGFATTLWISPDRRTSVAVSCNSALSDPGAIAAALHVLWT